MATHSIKLLSEIYNEQQQAKEAERIHVLNKCQKILKEYFKDKNITELYIAGSLLVPYKFSQRSDIDIAVYGLKAEMYFQAISDLEDLLERTVEIIELEHCSFVEKIRTSGLKII